MSSQLACSEGGTRIRCLEEKLRILPLLQNPDGVSIATMMDYISKCFNDFEMIASALGSRKHKPAPPLPRLKLADVTADGAALDEHKESQDQIKNCKMGSLRKRADLEASPALP